MAFECPACGGKGKASLPPRTDAGRVRTALACTVCNHAWSAIAPLATEGPATRAHAAFCEAVSGLRSGWERACMQYKDDWDLFSMAKGNRRWMSSYGLLAGGMPIANGASVAQVLDGLELLSKAASSDGDYDPPEGARGEVARLIASMRSESASSDHDAKARELSLPEPLFLALKVIVEGGFEFVQPYPTHIFVLSVLRMDHVAGERVLHVIDVELQSLRAVPVTDADVQRLADLLRACGLPREAPDTQPVSDTSVGSTVATVIVEWNDKRTTFSVSQQASGYAGLHAAPVAAFFTTLMTLAGLGGSHVAATLGRAR